MEERSHPTYDGGVSYQLISFQRHMKTMKKQINRVSDARLVADCQIFDEILSDELPFSFKSLTFECDGTIDSYEDLVRFENVALLH